jgi:hypothetical protein
MDKAIDAKLNEIGDISIIDDTEKLVDEGRKELSELSKETKDRASDFKRLRSLRGRLNKRSPELRALLESFRQYKLSLKTQIQQKQAALQAGPEAGEKSEGNV